MLRLFPVWLILASFLLGTGSSVRPVGDFLSAAFDWPSSSSSNTRSYVNRKFQDQNHQSSHLLPEELKWASSRYDGSGDSASYPGSYAASYPTLELESRHHGHQHSMEHHGKELGLAYPVLLALLLLGALFIPFLSLFFFLSVSAFNCNGFGQGGFGQGGLSPAGFQQVTPTFGKRRRRRDLSLLMMDHSQGNDSLVGAAQPEVGSSFLLVEPDQVELIAAQLVRSLANWLETEDGPL